MSEPITLQEAKAQLRLGLAEDSEDALIGSYIAAARAMVEGHTGLILTPRTVTETAAGLGRWIDLRAWPVTGITSVAYLDRGGVSQLLATGAWRVNLAARPVRLLPVAYGWGVAGGCAIDSVLPVTITVAAGFASSELVPDDIKQAIRLLVGHFHANREAVVADGRTAPMELPFAVKALLRPYRLTRV